MGSKEQWRIRAVARIEAWFERRSAPRTILSGILLVTGGTGIAVSFGLLQAGMDAMWLRYPLAVLAAYGVFLALVRIWVGIERWRLNPDTIEADFHSDAEGAGRTVVQDFGASRSWLDWLDAPSIDLDDGGCLVAAVIGAIGGIAAIAISVVIGAPALAAEVFLDAFLVGALYRRLKIASHDHWLGTAIARTWRHALLAAALLALTGWLASELAPDANSLGEAIEIVRSRSKADR
jgi:hypothetical protein